LTEEDPTFKFRTDENTGQIIISGMGELHLEILVERLVREFKVGVRVGRPQVAYRETITRSFRSEGEFVVQHGAKGQYARVVLMLEPLSKGKGFLFRNDSASEEVPLEFVSTVEASVRESLSGGVLAGYPVVDIGVALVGGTFDENRATEAAYHSAAAIAFNKGALQARPILMEPIMKLEVIVPEENMGDVIGDLNARRAEINGMDPQSGDMHRIRGDVPLAAMFGYATDLRSITQGRGSFTMEFDYYAPVPKEVSNRILGGPLV